jgi:hypothetical protein
MKYEKYKMIKNDKNLGHNCLGTKAKQLEQFDRDAKILNELMLKLEKVLIQRDWYDGGVGASFEILSLENGDTLTTRIVEFTGTNEAGEYVSNKYEIYTDGRVELLLD